jgi:hypothetical protein
MAVEPEFTAAWSCAVTDGVGWATRQISHGAPPDQVLWLLGFDDAEKLAWDLQNVDREVEIEEAVHFRIAFPGGSVRGIPNPKCIQAHLPRDRKPTPDEIRRAWNACVKKQ